MKLPEIEISIKYKGSKKTELSKICSSEDMYRVLKMMYDDNRFDWTEEMIMICLNRGNRVIGYYRISQGGTTGTMCDPKTVFTVALNCAGTCSIILSHNHPSGTIDPSPQDDRITEKLINAGNLLDIAVLDHLIVTSEGYYSYKDNNKI